MRKFSISFQKDDEQKITLILSEEKDEYLTSLYRKYICALVCKNRDEKYLNELRTHLKNADKHFEEEDVMINQFIKENNLDGFIDNQEIGYKYAIKLPDPYSDDEENFGIQLEFDLKNGDELDKFKQGFSRFKTISDYVGSLDYTQSLTEALQDCKLFGMVRKVIDQTDSLECKKALAEAIVILIRLNCRRR